MKRRTLIIIIIILISLCAAAITAQHFANIEKESTTAPVELTEAPQTAAPTEGSTEKSTAAETERPQTTETTAKPTEKPTQSTSKAETTKPQKPTSTTKPQTTVTTTTTTAATTEANKTTAPTTTAPTETAANTEKKKITVTISINCEKALAYGANVPESGYFLAPKKYTAQEGDTVFDVLEAAAKENGISLKYQSKSYVQSINGLSEKDCGGASGWTYKVNDKKPNKSAAKYELSDGDVIEWCYVMGPAD